MRYLVTFEINGELLTMTVVGAATIDSIILKILQDTQFRQTKIDKLVIEPLEYKY